MTVKFITANVDGQARKLTLLGDNVLRNGVYAACIQDLPSLTNRKVLTMLSRGQRESFKLYISGDRKHPSSRRIECENREFVCHESSYNSAILLDTRKVLPITHSCRYTSSRVSAICIGIRINDLQKSPLTLLSFYIRPRATFAEVEHFIDWIGTNQVSVLIGLANLIICGDTNANSPVWSPIDLTKEYGLTYSANESVSGSQQVTDTTREHYLRVKENRGRLLARALSRYRLEIANPSLKYGGSFRRGSQFEQGHIDIAALGNHILGKHIKSWFERLGYPRQSIEVSSASSSNKSSLYQHLALVISLERHQESQLSNDLSNCQSSSKSAYAFSSPKRESTRKRQFINFRALKEDHFLPLRKTVDYDLRMAEKLISQHRDYSNSCIWIRPNLYKLAHQRISIMNNLADELYKHLLQIQTTLTRSHTSRHSKQTLVLGFSRRLQKSISRYRKILALRPFKRRSFRKSFERASNMKIQRKRFSIIKRLCSHTNKHQSTQGSANRMQLPVKKTFAHFVTGCLTNHRKPWTQQKSERGTNLESISSQIDAKISNQTEFDALVGKHFKSTDRAKAEQLLENHLVEQGKLQFGCMITNSEVSRVIQDSKKKTYTGIEGLKFQLFLRSWNFTKDIVFAICKLSFLTNTVPKVCKTTLGSLVPKRQPNSYRIVHVGTPLASVLEQIALHRLEYALEAGNHFDKFQFGFVANRDRQDVLAILFANAFNLKRLKSSFESATTIINLDVQGAFDSVDQNFLVEKLFKDLWPNPICLWLARFILDREIIIKSNNFRSPPFKVSTGVPQGSPLGPILWNYAINHLSQGLSDDQTKTMMYADDIIICHNGTIETTKQNLESKLAILVSRLTLLNLKVNVQKSSMIHLRLQNKLMRDAFKTLNIIIDKTLLKPSDSINILGVRFNKFGDIDTAGMNYEQKKKIELAIRKLHSIKRSNVVKEAIHWKQLIDAHISSIVQINNIILMCISSKTRSWADKVMVKAARTIFGWSSNTSVKIIRLLTGIEQSKTVAMKLLLERASRESVEYYSTEGIYKTLLVSLNGSPELLAELDNYLEQGIETNLSNSSNTCRKQPSLGCSLTSEDASTSSGCRMHFSRMYHNPELQLDIQQGFIHLADIITGWIALERNESTLLVEFITIPFLVVSAMQFKHKTYPTSYFNTFTAIWNIISSNSTRNKRIILNPEHALLSALKNTTGNHDWRIITLREKLVLNGWTIVTPNTELVSYLKSLCYNWLQDASHQLQRSHNSDTNSIQSVNTNLIKSFCSSEPCVQDYSLMCFNRKLLAQYRKRMEQDNLTTMTELLCSSTKSWFSLSPSSFSPKAVLLLTGICSNRGKLVSGKLELQDRTKTFNCLRLNSKQLSSGSDCRLSQNEKLADTHLTLHRATNCINNLLILQKVQQLAGHRNDESGDSLISCMKEAFKTKRLAYKLISILSDAAFPN